MIQAVQRSLELPDKMRFGQGQFLVPRADGLGDLPGDRPFAEFRFGEVQRERIDAVAGALLREIGDRR